MIWLLWTARGVAVIALLSTAMIPFVRPHQFMKKVYAFTADLFEISLFDAALAVQIVIPLIIVVALFLLFGGGKYLQSGGGE